MKIVCLLSGGIDSTTLLFRLKKNNHDVLALFFNYGQKSFKKELESTKISCKILEVPLEILDVTGLGIISSGLTTDSIPASENPLFPGRNMILLSIAAAYAFTKFIDIVAIAVLSDSNFPDQTKEFIKSAESTISIALGHQIKIWSPFIELNKLEVVRIAKKYNFPLNFTYSCYDGGEKPCVKCLSCKDRRSVLELEHINDL